MIEFCGELSYECKKYIRKKVKRTLCLQIMPIVLILGALLNIFGILSDSPGVLAITITLTAVIVLSGCLIFSHKVKDIYSKIPTRVFFEDGTINIERESLNYSHSHVDVDNTALTHQPIVYARIKRSIDFDVSTKTNAKDVRTDEDKNHESRKISEVKKVIDMGDWYQIIFYFGYESFYFACQKDLIISGTIQDFESLFEDKIEPANSY